MPYTEREKLDLLGHVSSAFWSVHSDEERTRTPEFEKQTQELLGKAAADTAKIAELESSPNAADQLMVTILRARINICCDELIAAAEQKGSVADKKYLQFMALLFPSFGITDFPGQAPSDARSLMKLMLHPSTAN